MIKAIEILEQINQIPGSIDKENFLRANCSEEVKYLLKLAFDPYVTFGVKDFKLSPKNVEVPTFEFIQRLVRVIVGGEVVGNKLRDLMIDVLSSNSPLANKYLEAIFKKNLTIGLATKSINLVIPNLIPTFDVGLGDKFDEKYFNSISNWGVQFKFDGLRSICLVDENGNASFVSRNGKPQFNLEHIKQEIKELGLKSIVLDGEALASDWNETSSLVHSEKNIIGKTATNLKYYIFDYLTMEEWKSRKTAPYSIRLERIEKMFLTAKYLRKTATVKIANLEEAKYYFEIYFANGYEGAMLKNMDASYPFKRTRDWMKLKNEETYDLYIKSYVEGEGRLQGKLGKFICDLNGVEIGVGGGFTDSQRDEFWSKRERMLGTCIEVKCQEKTKDGSLRFPIFLRIRKDK
jgi:DNA ligase-1